jgi:hypothetical protein
MYLRAWKIFLHPRYFRTMQIAGARALCEVRAAPELEARAPLQRARPVGNVPAGPENVAVDEGASDGIDPARQCNGRREVLLLRALLHMAERDVVEADVG